ncbi:MAG: AI-2E family transporter [Kiritimatiellia bacterium]|jgi:AI-2 transport protein TqsA
MNDADATQPATESPEPASVGQKADLLFRFLLGAAATVIILGGLKIAASMLMQFLLIGFIVIVLSPVYYLLRNKARIPHWLAVTLVMLLITGFLVFATGVLLPSVVKDFSGNLPGYRESLTNTVNSLQAQMNQHNIHIPRGVVDKGIELVTGFLGQIGGHTISFVGSVFSNTIIVLIIVAFVFAELDKLPGKIQDTHWITPARWKLLTTFVEDVRYYMVIKTIISAFTGLLVFVGMTLLDVDAPGMLGLIAFIFNFIPVIGSIVAAIPGFVLALAGQGIGVSIATLGVYLVVNQLLGNVIEPRLQGKGFGVSPVLVLVSAIFWGWLLGPVGMLFAVPLTTAVRGAFYSRSDLLR